MPSSEPGARRAKGGTRDRSSQLLFSLGAVVTVVGCSLAVEADRRQCSTASDCVGHGLGQNAVCVGNVCAEPQSTGTDGGGDVDAERAPVDPIWGCLDNFPELPPEEPAEPVHFRTSFQSLLTPERFGGLPVAACKLDDPDCTAPLPGSATEVDANGKVDVLLHSGFRGFLNVSPSAKHADLAPAMITVLPLPDKRRPEGATGVIWALFTKSEINFVAASAGKQLNEDYGHVFFFATSCTGRSVGDVIGRAAPITADTYTWYTDAAGTPSLTQAKTTESGNGGFMNLPVGRVSLTLTLDGGRNIGTQEVIIRKGAITYINFGPSR